MKPLCAFLLLVSAIFAEDFAGRSRQLGVSLYNVSGILIKRFKSKWIFQELAKDNDNNFLVGPIFLETLIALSESGAAGATAAEIRTTFNFPDTNQELEEEATSLISTLQSISAVQNRIYYNGNYTIKDAFAKAAESVYQATIHENTEDVVDLTSNFVFRSDWNPHFVSSPIPNFYIDDETSIEVEGVLQSSTSYNYAENEELDAKFLELPFEAEGVSMVLILPRQKQGLDVLEKNIASVFALPKFEKQFVQVTLPKFKIAATLELSSFLEKVRYFTGKLHFIWINVLVGA